VRRWGLKTLIIDGAHNPQAAQALSDTWTMSPWKKNPARWIIGVLRDKDARGFLKPLAPYLEDVVVVRPSSPRARDPLELAELIRKMRPQARITIEQNPALAVRAWRRDKQAPPTVLCVGSLYLAGDVLKSLRRQA
jgi:dihydrofolate synthase/folylpolyglutamate synthase